MKLLCGAVIGAVVTLLLVALGAYLAVTNGWIPAGMDSGLLPGEKWAAHHDLNAVLQREATDKSPITADETNLLAGQNVYANNCSGCHGTPNQPKPAFGKGFNPAAPSLAKHGVTDDPEAETYWKVKHGIKWTGMPTFQKMLSEKEMWQVTLFLKNMDKLPPKVQQAWASTK